MLYREILNIVGTFLLGFAITLFLPIGVSIYFDYFVDQSLYPEPPSTLAFVYTLLISFSFAAMLKYFAGKSSGRVYRKEGLISVVLLWLFVPFFASLPFLLSGTLESPVQAYFEATSGITTTGASLFTPKNFNEEGVEIPYERVVSLELDTHYQWYGNINPIRNDQGKIIKEGIEAVSKGILFWRSFLQWLGGLGIVVLFVAVLPALGVGGKMLFHSEMPGPIKESLTPRIKETAILLWKIYGGLSIIQILLLETFNPELPFFDAICITLSTISTGGFTVINGSIGAYNSVSMEWIVMVFMLLGSINFSIYYYILQGKIYRIKDIELIVYFIILLVSSLYVSTSLLGTIKHFTTEGTGEIYTIGNAIREGFFQVISAQTSSGFAVANYDQWGYPMQVLMLILIYIGGMAGSTAGGMKVIRHIMTFRIVQDKVELLFRPETVRSFRIGNKLVDKSAAMTVLSFFVIVLAFAVLGTFLLVLDGLDPESALTVITSTINNSGMGFREAGPTDSFAFLSNFGLSLTSIWMILGRLEFFTVLVILVPAFWKEN